MAREHGGISRGRWVDRSAASVRLQTMAAGVPPRQARSAVCGPMVVPHAQCAARPLFGDQAHPRAVRPGPLPLHRQRAAGRTSSVFISSLSDLVYGKRVKVNQQGRDRYGRVAGRVYTESLDVNRQQRPIAVVFPVGPGHAALGDILRERGLAARREASPPNAGRKSHDLPHLGGPTPALLGAVPYEVAPRE